METWTLQKDEVSVQDEGNAVRFRVDCRPPCEVTRLLRCYGENKGADFLVGVLEPENGRLRLDRRVSRETLRQAGVEALPQRFYLSDGGARERSEAADGSEKGVDLAQAAVQEPSEEPMVEPLQKPVETPLQELAESGAVEDFMEKERTAEPPAKTERSPKEDVSAGQKMSRNLQPMGRKCPLRKLREAEEGAAPSRPPAVPRTGDPLLDAALMSGEAHWELTEQGLRISCPFAAEQPFVLAFAAALCRVEQGTAILDWKKGARKRSADVFFT